MAGDSAFRRLLLDTVAQAIAQPPSSSSLIELLRIATPNLAQCEEANVKIRDAPQREKLFRTLQLRIHPDKHPGDERATVLFQEVTLFYGRCVEAVESEDQRARTQKSQWSGSNNCNHDRADAQTTNFNDNGNDDGGQHDKAKYGNCNSNGNYTRYPQWKYPWWYHDNNPNAQNPHREKRHYPNSPGSSRGTSRATHAEYENAHYYNEHSQSTFNPNVKSNGVRTRGSRRGRQPSSHQAFAALSTILFPPLGICALVHSFRVQKAWNEERYSDARHHSEQAYSYAWFGSFCFCCIFLYLWLGDGDLHWNWDKMKHNLPWDDGP